MTVTSAVQVRNWRFIVYYSWKRINPYLQIDSCDFKRPIRGMKEFTKVMILLLKLWRCRVRSHPFLLAWQSFKLRTYEHILRHQRGFSSLLTVHSQVVIINYVILRYLYQSLMSCAHKTPIAAVGQFTRFLYTGCTRHCEYSYMGTETRSHLQGHHPGSSKVILYNLNNLILPRIVTRRRFSAVYLKVQIRRHHGAILLESEVL